MSRFSLPIALVGNECWKVFIAKYAEKFRRGREENQRGFAGGLEVPQVRFPESGHG